MITIGFFRRLSLGQLISGTNPLGQTVSYAYNSAGMVVSKTDNQGVIKSFTYKISWNIPMGDMSRVMYLVFINSRKQPTARIWIYT
jgi:YD repeat-containing protein